MERHDLLALMAKLKLYGMRAAYDETFATALKRQRAAADPRRPLARRDGGEAGTVDQVSDHGLQAAAGQGARRVRVFRDTPINEALVRDLAGGGFIAQQRNAVFIGGTEPNS